MKIQVKSGDKRITLLFPTMLLCNSTVLRVGLKIARKYDASGTIPDIEAEKLAAMCREIRRIKRKHKHYELVQVSSAGRAGVRIVL